MTSGNDAWQRYVQSWGQPLASTQEEAIRYVQNELEQALPAGWVLRGVEGDSLAWIVEKREIQSGEWPHKGYGIRVVRSLDLVVFTHGNKDVGPLSLDHVLARALVIDAASLRHFGISACLEYLMSSYEPDEWGYT